MKSKTKSSRAMQDSSCICGCHGTWAMISGILVIIGSLNWGLYGLGILLGNPNWNVVGWIFGSWPTFEAIIYLIVGIAGIAMLIGVCKGCR